ncbi:MAG: EAL domain-containing protein [Clostridia bacterium]|nr:EAL domain-containing protein [Clostridia bacterium]MDY5554256.1 EAL domain-containing protein [Blautia sp.]
MKLLMGILLALSLAVMVLCLFATHFKEHDLKNLVQNILSIAILIIFNYEIVLFLDDEQWNLFAHSIYFVATDWILYYLLQFSIEYSGSDFNQFVRKKAMIFLLMADSASLLLNTVSGHLFSLYVSDYKGESYYAMSTKPPFYVHYFIIIMLVSFCLISLFYRAFHMPLFYRSKYLAIAVILVIIILANIISFKKAIDFSIIGYSLEGIALYYCTFVFTPQRLLRKTLLLVSQDMTIGLIVLDIEGKLLYSNNFARDLLTSDSTLTDNQGMSFMEWCRKRYFSNEDNAAQDYIFYRGSDKITLNIQFQNLMDSHNNLQGAYFVIYDRTEEINKMKEERFLATHDSLTGLYNKSYFCHVVEGYIKSHTEEELLLLCTNIKDFKMINDLFGSQMGDMILKGCADIIRLKENKAIVYGRLNNDIFALLIRKSDFNENQFMSRMQEIFSSEIENEFSYPLINYIGVYEIIDRSIPVAVMCDRAKLAISKIKGDYHNRVAYYNETLRNDIRYETELISDLDDAIKQKQLKMYLQPQVSSDGKMLGAEALVRWEHPVKGMISPGQFIPVFEKNGLISDVDKYIWETACQQLLAWKKQGRDNLYISVNISPRDFYFLNIYQIFTELVEKYDINPRNLKLEITETAIIMDFQRQMELISKLREYGFSVEMDDFGSGNSSLNMLKDIYVDILKIDMIFLQKAQDEERSKKILQMIISLSKELGMPVITEGVETVEQVQFLTQMGCDMFQGYYFARPMKVEQFEKIYFTD